MLWYTHPLSDSYDHFTFSRPNPKQHSQPHIRPRLPPHPHCHKSRPQLASNRKRAHSTSEKKSGRRTPSSSTSAHHAHSQRGDQTPPYGRQGQRGGVEDEVTASNEGKGQVTMAGKAPSLDVDIRNSLILPGLSQRFSVLLPSLSTAPEESLRALLASQRARHNGPALTLEEEELLFAEIRDAAEDRAGPDDRWDGRPPPMTGDWPSTGTRQSNGNGSGNAISPTVSSPSTLTTSISSPSILTSSDDGQPQALTPNTSNSGWHSPPPTSNSFSSFKTFGVGASPEQPAHGPGSGVGAGVGLGPGSAGFKTKSYGFSGGSGMRDGEYIRRVKKTASHKDLGNGSVSSRKSDQSGEEGTPPARDHIPLPPAISPEKANAYYQPTRRAESPTLSERTATPTSSMVPMVTGGAKQKKGHSPASSLSFPPIYPAPPTPESPEDRMMVGKQQRSKRRQSRLAGLTPAQVKRISLALEEIGGELKRGNSIVRHPQGSQVEQSTGSDDVEEMLEGEEKKPRPAEYGSDPDSDRYGGPSEIRSEDSCASATSSVFPFKMSPTNSTFTTGTTTEPTSPAKLPPSPKSYNLLAHVEEPLPPVPVPVFTPTRSQPVRHQPSLSSSSTAAQVPSQGQAVYIPGQPRPVRLTHHSQSSISSRSNTPSGQSPLDALRSATASPEYGWAESSPSPLHGRTSNGIKSSSLGRSRSVNHANTTPTRPSLAGVFGEGSGSFTRRRAGTVGEQPLSRQLSSHSPAPEIIEESEENASDQDVDVEGYAYSRGSHDGQGGSEDHCVPEVKQVTSRHSVSRSRRTESEASIHQLQQSLGWNLAASGVEPYERTVSMQGTIVSNFETPPSEEEAKVNGSTPGGQVQVPQSPTTTLRRQASSHSLSSSFAEPDVAESEIRWTGVFESSRPESCELDTDLSPSPTKSAEMFRKMSGMGLEDLARLQERLVVKAKQEREALRGESGESPVISYTPTMSAEPFKPPHQPISPLLARPLSPPTSWRFPPTEAQPQIPQSQSTTPSQEKSTLSSSTDTHILTPPLTGTTSSVTSAATPKPIGLPSRPAPPPPVQPSAETLTEMADESMSTPPTELSRNASTKVHPRMPLEENPEIRRDFEARIAAATAALNRTPSIQASGSKLERKFTKRGGPMVISSPTLVSSTATVPTTPLTPENQVDHAPAKVSGSEKAGGSGSKMSLRWKKFAGLRNKGPSFSGNEVTPFPPPGTRPTPQEMRLNPPAQTQGQAQTHARTPSSLQRSQSASAARKLDDPINLRPIDNAPPSAPPDLNAFRFPPPPERVAPSPPAQTEQVHTQAQASSPPPSAPVSSGLKHALSKMKRKDDKHDAPRGQSPQLTSAARPISPQPAPAVRAQSPLPNLDAIAAGTSSKDAPASADDAPLHKFIEAGRQLGLNEEQIHAMLAAKGMTSDRSVSGSGSSTAPSTVGATSNTAPAPAPPVPASPPSVQAAKPASPEREKKGLFRALSKSRRNQAPPPISAPVGLEPAAPISDSVRKEPVPVHDRVVVRRTMILPEGLNIIPSTPQTVSTPRVPESPDSSLTRLAQGQGRKQSVRRKPLNLSKEDQELVSNSPPAHQRNFSFSTSQSGRSVSDTTVNTQPPTAGPSPANAGAPTPSTELHGLGFLHPNTPLGANSVSTTVSPATSMDDDSHARSSAGGSLIDMYVNGDEEEEMLQPSPEKRTVSMFDDAGAVPRASVDESRRLRRQTQAVEITEYADGQVVWNIVDALRTSVSGSGSVDGDEYAFDPAAPHSRTTSYSSSVRDSVIPETADVFTAGAPGAGAGWPRGISAGTQGLNFRHRDRNLPKKPRPPTDVYFTSSRDVADLIDHLSQDLDASHGRINFTHFSPAHEPILESDAQLQLQSQWATSHSSPFMYRDSTDRAFDHPQAQAQGGQHEVLRGTEGDKGTPESSPNPQFEDAPSPAPARRAPPAHILPPSASALLASNPSTYSPKRQLFVNQSLGPGSHSRQQSYASGGLSPSAKSFASSSTQGQEGRSVEDRLQALLDRLKDSGVGRP